MPPEPGDPTVCRAWPGFGTTFSNPLNTVQPYVVDDAGFNGAEPMEGTWSGYRAGWWSPGTLLDPRQKGRGAGV